MRPSPTSIIEAIANAQHGVVSRAQLLDRGMHRSSIDRRLGAGRLLRVHRGVYARREGLDLHARARAATLACGARSFVSHSTAGALADIVPEPDRGAPIHISLPGRGHRRVAGIRKHLDWRGAPEDITVLDGIPIATPVRTLIDLAPVLDPRSLEQAVARAERNGLVRAETLRAAIVDLPGRPGVARLLQLLRLDERTFTRSAAEELFVGLVREADLPVPRSNRRVGPFEVDFLWPEERVIVEVDGYDFHSSRQHFESDRARDADLASRGYRVVRVTWRQLADKHQRVPTLVRLVQTLALAAAGR